MKEEDEERAFGGRVERGHRQWRAERRRKRVGIKLNCSHEAGKAHPHSRFNYSDETNADVNELGQSWLTHTRATTLALFSFLCCLHQALEVFALCLSCLTRCLLLFNSVSGCVTTQRRRQDKEQGGEVAE